MLWIGGIHYFQGEDKKFEEMEEMEDSVEVAGVMEVDEVTERPRGKGISKLILN